MAGVLGGEGGGDVSNKIGKRFFSQSMIAFSLNLVFVVVTRKLPEAFNHDVVSFKVFFQHLFINLPRRFEIPIYALLFFARHSLLILPQQTPRGLQIRSILKPWRPDNLYPSQTRKIQCVQSL